MLGKLTEFFCFVFFNIFRHLDSYLNTDENSGQDCLSDAGSASKILQQDRICDIKDPGREGERKVPTASAVESKMPSVISY